MQPPASCPERGWQASAQDRTGTHAEVFPSSFVISVEVSRLLIIHAIDVAGYRSWKSQIDVEKIQLRKRALYIQSSSLYILT